MVNYTGEYWQKDILYRDLRVPDSLIYEIASRLYRDEYSEIKRREKLLEISEMSRLDDICKKESAGIRKLLRSFDSTRGKTMQNPNTPVTNADMAEAQKFLADDTDAFNALLATKAIEDGTTYPPLLYITDADETADEPTPTVH